MKIKSFIEVVNLLNYYSDIKSKRIVVDIPEPFHSYLKKQANKRKLSIKKYVIKAVLEKLKQEHLEYVRCLYEQKNE